MVDPADEAFRLTTLTGGALSILTGLIMLVWPGQTLRVIAALLGVWLIIIGIVRVIQAASTKTQAWQTRALIGASGVLYTIVGAVSLRNLYDTVAMMAVIIGLVWIVGGVAEIAWRRGSTVLIGLFSVFAGVTVLLWPEISLLSMALVAGIWLVAFGLLHVFLALTHRHRTAKAPASL